MKLLSLSRSDVGRVVSMRDAVDVVAEAFHHLSSGKAFVPVRTRVPVESRQAVSFFMPAYLSKSDQLGMKLVSVFPQNPSMGLPTIHAIVALVDAETGVPNALVDGTFLTALRTGAASGAATRLLAGKDAKTVAILGAGAQGRTQLEAVCAVRAIERVHVYDAQPALAQVYVEEMSSHETMRRVSIEAAPSAAEAIRDADIICTATTSSEPVFEDSDLKTGVHINAIGSFTPEMQELPAATVIRARVIVDSREACWEEAGDLLVPKAAGQIDEEHVDAELGELVPTGFARRDDDNVTVFKTVGVAVQDVAVASLAVRRAVEQGVGTWVEL